MSEKNHAMALINVIKTQITVYKIKLMKLLECPLWNFKLKILLPIMF